MITVCGLSSALFFILGCVWGHKHRRGTTLPNTILQLAQPNPTYIYEEVLPKSTSASQFELKENTAYGPLK